MAQGGNDQPGHYMLEHYNVEEAFKHLNRSPALTLDQKAGLEFAYIEVLARPWDSRDTLRYPEPRTVRRGASRAFRSGDRLDLQAQGRRDRPRRVPGPA